MINISRTSVRLKYFCDYVIKISDNCFRAISSRIIIKTSFLSDKIKNIFRLKRKTNKSFLLDICSQASIRTADFAVNVCDPLFPSSLLSHNIIRDISKKLNVKLIKNQYLINIKINRKARKHKQYPFEIYYRHFAKKRVFPFLVSENA